MCERKGKGREAGEGDQRRANCSVREVKENADRKGTGKGKEDGKKTQRRDREA